MPFAGTNSRKTYLCFHVFGGGPGAFHGMMSSRSDGVNTDDDDESPLAVGNVMPVAMKWHISAHSGLSRDGASGSVSVMVYVRFGAAPEPEGRVTENVGSS